MLLTGFYGKLPSHGDFISRRLPREFLDHWDEWLQGGIAHSQKVLADQWLTLYLNAPVWRFVLSDGVCGEGIWYGVIIPSMDKVGRYFPLTFAGHIQQKISPMKLMAECGYWIERLEDIAYSVLDDDFDLETMEQDLNKLGNPTIRQVDDLFTGSSSTKMHSRPHLQVALDAGKIRPLQAMPAVTEYLINKLFNSYSFWWTQGTTQIQPAFLCSEGLPALPAFTSLLTGMWNEGGWLNLGTAISHTDSATLME
ncbi:type VI secretion system-associated protein TagF [Spartinivicinus poritis]|uniref:Type VI secretion system-associated protein TagF n=1 Tax=Spartinivicinus poritis TaxID=2994640 RepID=A0ABT5UGF8_9GAMM|nr:type VI secretion system-associated protein TagF [Spartinivicinus sp. A2-2]MDE1465476.1 type VI secretion system-associated protein TagF [Spartinivicinus sp. A2-2]